MQDYEESARIQRTPVILPPSADGENPPPAPEEAAPVLPVFRPAGRKIRVNRLLFVQSLLCVGIFLALLALRSAAPEQYEAIRGWYNAQMQQALTVDFGASADRGAEPLISASAEAPPEGSDAFF